MKRTAVLVWRNHGIPGLTPGVMIVTAIILAAGLASAQATIEGTVVNRVTRAGIEGVLVRVFTQKGIRYETTTSGGGVFRITGVQDGEYRTELEKEGFETPARAEFPPREPTTRVTGKDAVRLSFEMLEWTTLKGRVIGVDGKPAAQVPVEMQGPLTGSRGRIEATSGDDGSFTFTRLLPGTFTLVARPKVQPAQTPPGDEPRIETVATYYPSAVEPSQRQQITIRGIAEESGYEIRLRSVPVFRVRGVVLDESGKPAKGMIVQLMREDNQATGRSFLGNTVVYTPGMSSLPEDEGVITGADGRFEFPSVREGDWTVRAESDWERQEGTKRDIQRVGTAAVLVSRRDPDDVEIRPVANFDFTVTVDWGDVPRGPAGRRWASIMLRPVDGGFTPTAENKPDGTLLFERVYPGRYFVTPMFGIMPGAYVSAILYGGRDVLGQPIDLSPSPAPMQIVYKAEAGIVRGTIAGGVAATVVLIPSSNQSVEFARSMECAAGAMFEFANLRPGDYSVMAFDRVDGAKLSSASYVASLVPGATRVKVEPRGNAVLELRVNRWQD